MRREVGFAKGMMIGADSERDNNRKVFDWIKAMALIANHEIVNASAGLAEDWSYTSGTILKDGEIPNEAPDHMYLESHWATPILVDEDTQNEYECWEDPAESNWGADTWWPQESRKMFFEDMKRREERDEYLEQRWGWWR